MPRHFSKLWNSPKSYNSKDIKLEQKIYSAIDSIKFWLWSIFKK